MTEQIPEPLDAEALRRLAEAATPGPWFFAYMTVHAQQKMQPWEDLNIPEPHTAERRGRCEGCPDRQQGCSYWKQFEDMDPAVAFVNPSYGDTATGQRVADAEFIAAANPQTMLALLGEVDRLRNGYYFRRFSAERHAALARAEKAEAQVQAVRALAEKWARLAPDDDDWGDSLSDTIVADAGRAILSVLDGTEKE